MRQTSPRTPIARAKGFEANCHAVKQPLFISTPSDIPGSTYEKSDLTTSAQFMSAGAKPLIGIIMGSQSDWEIMKHTASQLDELKVPYEAQIISAHRTPDLLFEYASSAVSRGLEVIIAAAGGAAH